MRLYVIIDQKTGEIVFVPNISEAEQYIAVRRYASLIDIYIDGNGISYFVDFGSDILF